MFIRVSVGSARSCPTRPAEWKVDPLVELVAVDEQNVRLAELSQVVRDAGTAHAAADDDDPGPVGKVAGRARGWLGGLFGHGASLGTGLLKV